MRMSVDLPAPGPGAVTSGFEVSYLSGTVSLIIEVVETPEYRERNTVQMTGVCVADGGWSKI